MTVTTSVPITVDGVTLNTYGYGVKTRARRARVAGLVTPNTPIPNRPGELYRSGKMPGPGGFVLEMFVQGTDVNGVLPSTFAAQEQQMEANWGYLISLLRKEYGLLDVRQTMRDGSVRQCFAEVISEIEADVPGRVPVRVLNVEFSIPGTYWQDVTNTVYTSAAGVTDGTTLTLAGFAGATAPMRDLQVQVIGAATNPKITDVSSGASLLYSGTVAAGHTLTVDAGAWSAVDGATNVIGSVSHSGDPALFRLSHGRPAGTSPTIRFNGASLSGATQVVVTGKRKYESV